MAAEQRVIQCLVGVLQVAQEGVALEIGVEFAESLQAARDLSVHAAHGRRQQAMQAEGGAFFVGEGRALVEARVGEKPVAEQFGRRRVSLVLFARIAQPKRKIPASPNGNTKT